MSTRMVPEPEPEPEGADQDGQDNGIDSDGDSSDDERSQRSPDTVELPEENMRQSQRWFALQIKEEQEEEERRRQASCAFWVRTKWMEVEKHFNATCFATTRRMILFSFVLLFTYSITVFCFMRLATLALVVNDPEVAETDGD